MNKIIALDTSTLIYIFNKESEYLGKAISKGYVPFITQHHLLELMNVDIHEVHRRLNLLAKFPLIATLNFSKSQDPGGIIDLLCYEVIATEGKDVLNIECLTSDIINNINYHKYLPPRNDYEIEVIKKSQESLHTKNNIAAGANRYMTNPYYTKTIKELRKMGWGNRNTESVVNVQNKMKVDLEDKKIETDQADEIATRFGSMLKSTILKAPSFVSIDDFIKKTADVETINSNKRLCYYIMLGEYNNTLRFVSGMTSTNYWELKKSSYPKMVSQDFRLKLRDRIEYELYVDKERSLELRAPLKTHKIWYTPNYEATRLF